MEQNVIYLSRRRGSDSANDKMNDFAPL